MRWRDPNLTEVIGFLNNPNNVIKANAAAYLQHLCYMDDPNKQKTRSLGGIQPLVVLLNHDSPDVYRNACGALRYIFLLKVVLLTLPVLCMCWLWYNRVSLYIVLSVSQHSILMYSFVGFYHLLRSSRTISLWMLLFKEEIEINSCLFTVWSTWLTDMQWQTFLGNIPNEQLQVLSMKCL